MIDCCWSVRHLYSFEVYYCERNKCNQCFTSNFHYLNLNFCAVEGLVILNKRVKYEINASKTCV